jgi:hypothetical protein
MDESGYNTVRKIREELLIEQGGAFQESGD